MENLSYWELGREVPKEAQRKIEGGNLGKAGFTDINPVWRIKKLTEMFGMCGFGWYYKTIDIKTENASDGEILVFVTINLFIKVNNEWSMPIEGQGGNTMIAKTKNGLKNSDEAIKMATTDALSVCCKMLGIGADIYFSKDAKFETKYENSNNNNNTSNKPFIAPKQLKGWTDTTRQLTRDLIVQNLKPDQYNNISVKTMNDSQLLTYGKIAKQARENKKNEGLSV